MKKLDLYKIGRKDYLLDDILIDKIILKNLNISKNNLFLMSEIEDSENILKDFEKYNSGYPIEYILGEAEFYSLKFFVDNRVLIPRNDTEIIVTKVLEEIAPPKSPSIEGEAQNEQGEFILIDIGTGSSCIPISILKNLFVLPKKTYVLDISKDALAISKINIEKHDLSDKIVQVESDLLSAFTPPQSPSIEGETQNEQGEFKLVSTLIITANLPYIKSEDLDNMDDGVFFFEPNVALFGGKETGFELYEKLITQTFELKETYKLEKIILFIEIGFDQLEYSRKYLKDLNLNFEYFKDMNNIERTIKITF